MSASVSVVFRVSAIYLFHPVFRHPFLPPVHSTAFLSSHCVSWYGFRTLITFFLWQSRTVIRLFPWQSRTLISFFPWQSRTVITFFPWQRWHTSYTSVCHRSFTQNKYPHVSCSQKSINLSQGNSVGSPGSAVQKRERLSWLLVVFLVTFSQSVYRCTG